MSDALVQRSGRGLSPLTTSRWPGIEGVPATRLWPGGAVPCGTATSRGVPLPPPRQCGLSSPTRAIMHGGHSTAPGATSTTAPRKTRGRRGGVDQRPAGPTLHIARCPAHQGTHHTRRLPRPRWEFTSPPRAETSLRVVSLVAARCLKGCHGTVTPSRHRTAARAGGGERFRAPRPWVSALSAAATHPQTVQVGPSNAPDHPTEGLDRGGYAAAASQRPTHRPLALTSCSASRSRGATQRTKPARAAPKKQPDLARNSGARCLPNTPQNGGCRVRPFPLPFSLILSLSFSLSLVSLPLSFSQ